MDKIIMADFSANFQDTRDKIKQNKTIQLSHYKDEASDKIGLHFQFGDREDDTIDIYVEIEELFRFFTKIIKEGD